MDNQIVKMTKKEALKEYTSCQLALHQLTERISQLEKIILEEPYSVNKQEGYSVNFLPSTNETVIQALTVSGGQLSAREIVKITGLSENQVNAGLGILFKKNLVNKHKDERGWRCKWSINNSKEQNNG